MTAGRMPQAQSYLWRKAPSDQATAIPSTSTFQAGLARPPIISVLAGRCVPSIAARPARALGDIGWVAHDRGDLHQILNLHTGSTQLCLQIPPRQRALRLGVIRDAAIGSDADLPAR